MNKCASCILITIANEFHEHIALELTKFNKYDLHIHYLTCFWRFFCSMIMNCATDELVHSFEFWTSQCVDNCIFSSSYIPCQLQWPRLHGDFAEPSAEFQTNKTVCRGAEDYARFGAAFGRMQRNDGSNFTSLLKECGCPRRCSSTRWSLYNIIPGSSGGRATDRQSGGPGFNS